MSGGDKKNTPPEFVHVAQSVGDGSDHSIGITASGTAYSWSRRGNKGALGRDTGSLKKAQQPHPVTFQQQQEPSNNDDAHSSVRVIRGFAGGTCESGHSVLLDQNRRTLWVAGCDRWQQLGLGSSKGGASGYTWEQGRIWRKEFVRNDFVGELMKQQDDENTTSSVFIRDVALGGDHSVVLSSNQRDVYTFGKGGEGQLGLTGKPFVSAPVKSTKLSSDKNSEQIAAVCAIQHCSLTIDKEGSVLKHAGKCKLASKGFRDGLAACVHRARSDGLLSSPGSS